MLLARLLTITPGQSQVSFCELELFRRRCLCRYSSWGERKAPRFDSSFQRPHRYRFRHWLVGLQPSLSFLPSKIGWLLILGTLLTTRSLPLVLMTALLPFGELPTTTPCTLRTPRKLRTLLLLGNSLATLEKLATFFSTPSLPIFLLVLLTIIPSRFGTLKLVRTSTLSPTRI